jgi:phasin family protein
MARKPGGPASAFDFEEMWRAFGSMAPDWGKALQGVPPGKLWQDMVRSQQRNVEAVTKLNEAVAHAMRQVGERQLELIRATMAEAQKIGQAMGRTGGASAAPEAVSAAFERALTAMRDIAEIAEKANREALEAITKRSEAFEAELREMMAQAPATERE